MRLTQKQPDLYFGSYDATACDFGWRWHLGPSPLRSERFPHLGDFGVYFGDASYYEAEVGEHSRLRVGGVPACKYLNGFQAPLAEFTRSGGLPRWEGSLILANTGTLTGLCVGGTFAKVDPEIANLFASANDVGVTVGGNTVLEVPTLVKRLHIEIRFGAPFSTDFIRRAKILEDQGHGDLALDIIFDAIDELLHARAFAFCSSILSDVDAAQCSADVLLALLSATLPVKSKLPTRGSFFQRVERELRRRGEYEDDLLDGLG